MAVVSLLLYSAISGISLAVLFWFGLHAVLKRFMVKAKKSTHDMKAWKG